MLSCGWLPPVDPIAPADIIEPSLSFYAAVLPAGSVDQ